MQGGQPAPPTACPSCHEALEVSRLRCPACETEVHGRFANSGGAAGCDLCHLGDDDRRFLRLFLASRGNLKDLERHLGVSYPTVRARFDAFLARVGVTPVTGESRPDVLQALARGELDLDEALDAL